MLNRNSITEKFFLYFLTICMVTIVVVSSYSYYSARKALLARTFEQLTSVRVEKTNNINRFFLDRERDIQLLAKSEVISEILAMMGKDKSFNKNLFNNEYEKYLSIYLRSNGYYKNLILVKNDGTMLCIPTAKNDSVTRFISGDISSTTLPIREFIAKISESNSPEIQDYTKDQAGNPRLYTGISLPGGSDSISDLILLEISIDVINSIMYENNAHNGLGKTGESYLVGSDFLMRTSSRFQENSLFKTFVRTEATLDAFSGNTGVGIIHDYRNKEVLSSFGKISVPGLNWVIAAEIDTSEAMIPVYSLRNSILLLSLILSLLLFGVVSIISRRITSPIILLKEAAVKIAEGFYHVRLEVTSGDEIGALTDAFNKMSEKLEHQSEQISSERIRRLSSMIDGQELERRRLSRDLHDGLGQSLLAVKMKLEQATGSDPEKNARVISTTGEMIHETIREIREISSNLMPPVLEAFGLEQGLENLCKSTSAHSDFTVSFIKNIKIPLTDSRQQIYLYRIAQEALNNITKHSGATEAKICLNSDHQEIVLEISDNGKGFQPGDPVSGNGLTNIRERTELLNGHHFIITAPGKGTRITIRIPLKNEKDKHHTGR